MTDTVSKKQRSQKWTGGSEVKSSPGLYRSHTVNTPRVVGAHTPLLNVTAVISLRGDTQMFSEGVERLLALPGVREATATATAPVKVK